MIAAPCPVATLRGSAHARPASIKYGAVPCLERGGEMRLVRALVLTTVVAFVSLSVGSSPVQGTAFAIPCTDARGCPDLVPNTTRHRSFVIIDRTFLATNCAVQEGMTEAGERRLLRFAVEAANGGAGDLVVGAPEHRPDLFTWSPCHGHYHFLGFAQYRLWAPAEYAAWANLRAANPGVPASELMASAGLTAPLGQTKRAFCMEDTGRYLSGNLGEIGGPKYTCGNQGISAGWSDLYGSTLDGQWIDVTGVPSGRYVLEWELNPERTIEESVFGNNAASIPVVIGDHPGSVGE